MPRHVLKTSSRLHFGLLSWGGPKLVRQFGGVGLMIESPGLEIVAKPSASWEATGPLSSRVLAIASKVVDQLASRGDSVDPVRFEVRRSAPEHVGLGVGTQLGLGVARILSDIAGQTAPTIADLALLSGRGLRSGIGLHGFEHGGLIVDGGRRGPEAIPPLLSRLEFPDDWSILVVIPQMTPSLHGSREVQAFANLPPSTDALTDRLCRVVLLGLLPSVVERDLDRFGEALEEIQRRVGEGFAPIQGGPFARPEFEAIAAELRSEGLKGVGQSSWGPTLYGLTNRSLDDRLALLERIRGRFGLLPQSAYWTVASRSGAALTVDPKEIRSGQVECPSDQEIDLPKEPRPG